MSSGDVTQRLKKLRIISLVTIFSFLFVFFVVTRLMELLHPAFILVLFLFLPIFDGILLSQQCPNCRKLIGVFSLFGTVISGRCGQCDS